MAVNLTAECFYKLDDQTTPFFVTAFCLKISASHAAGFFLHKKRKKRKKILGICYMIWNKILF